MDRLRELVAEGRFGEIAEEAGRRKGILGRLLPLTYDPDPLRAWRAVEALGAAAGRIADDSPESVRNFLRRLHWLLNDESGGVCPRAPEAMAEIVRRRPLLFPDYVPIVVHLLDEEEENPAGFKEGILWAVGRLGPAARDAVASILPVLAACLEDSSSQVRGLAAWALGETGRGDLLAGRGGLLSDEGPVDLYEGGRLVRWSVGALARRALGGAAG